VLKGGLWLARLFLFTGTLQRLAVAVKRTAKPYYKAYIAYKAYMIFCKIRFILKYQRL